MRQARAGLEVVREAQLEGKCAAAAAAAGGYCGGLLAPRWRNAIAQRLLEAAPALEPLLSQTRRQRTRYSLVGGDALIQSNGDAKLIELNMYPNLFSGWDLVDKDSDQSCGQEWDSSSVFLPLLEDMMAFMLMGERRDRFECIFSGEDVQKY
eukprot:s1035_g5.t1